MAYYYPEEMKRVLDDYPEFRESLYCRGFLITGKKIESPEAYPFYAGWTEHIFHGGEICFYVHALNNVFFYERGEKTYFLIGHAYDPFHMITDENELLKRMAEAGENGISAYWDEESNLTGVFCTGFFTGKSIFFSTDCTGMQLVYYGAAGDSYYITSHSKLAADLTGIEQTEYIRRLTGSRFWHYWGAWLPADVSPYAELKRLNPNSCGKIELQTNQVSVKRYYPVKAVTETTTEAEYQETIHELGSIMENTMACIAGKWPEKKISVSVTGGRDSMTTLSCCRKIYDQFSYFSYISNKDEEVDAFAARDILAHLGLEHEIIEIPQEWQNEEELNAFKKVMECNNGCIIANNANDLRKRLYFLKHPPCDIEVKSWVNEMGRGWEYNKYNKRHFPKYPYASYWRAMHKVYLDKYLIKKTDDAFAEYMKRYYSKTVFDRLSWLELYFWEFTWSGGEGIFLTSEHRIPFDITIPYNNRKYIEKMLTVPLDKRINDEIPIDLTKYMEPRIAETGITIHDISHTDFRAFIIRNYLEIMSKVRFGRKKEVFR